MLAGAQLAVGAAAIFARLALSAAQPLAVSALRLTIAVAVLWAIALLRGSRARLHLGTRERALLALAGIMLAAHFATWIWSLQYTTVAISTLLVATTPLWTTLYDAAVLRRRYRLQTWLAYLLAAGGLLLVVRIQGPSPPIPGHAALGCALAVAGSLAIGAYFLIVRRIREGRSTRTIVTHTYAWAALALVAAAAIARQGPPPLDAHTAGLGIIAMALVSQLLGHTALNAALRWFTATAVAMATLLEPVAAAVLAALFLREPVGAATVAGGVLLLIAIALVLKEEAGMELERSAVPIGSYRE